MNTIRNNKIGLSPARQWTAKLASSQDQVKLAQQKLEAAKALQQKLRREALDALCPFDAGMRIALSKAQFFKVHVRSLIGDEESGLVQWKLEGAIYRIINGRDVLHEDNATLDQEAYEALSEDVRNLTATEQKVWTAKKAARVAAKPLKLTLKQRTLFKLCLSGAGRVNLIAGRIPTGARLETVNITQQQWKELVLKGVLCLVDGDLARPFQTWKVKVGPRYQEACDLVDKQAFNPVIQAISA